MSTSHIGTLTEKNLHAQLKTWVSQPGDRLEVPIDGYIIDIVRDHLLIEIQTRNFAALKSKLAKLLPHHPIHLLYPIAEQKWIIRQTASGQTLTRRKSPKHGRTIDLFDELVYIPHLLTHPNLTIKAILTHQEEIWRDDGKGSWRRKHWSIHDRRLLQVVSHTPFHTLTDLLTLLPDNLTTEFTNHDLATALKCRPRLAQKITSTLRKTGILTPTGKRGRAILYTITPP